MELSAGRLLRWCLSALLFVAAALCVVSLGVVAEGERAMRVSDKAFDDGRLEEALVQAQRAATLYAPGAPHQAAAYDRLVAIAVGSERSGDGTLAVRAWRAVRGAILETRHFRIVELRLLDLANHNLARLQAQAFAQQVTNADRVRANSEALAALSHDEAPRARWVGVLGLGFALTTAGLIWAIGVGVTREGAVVWSRLRWPGVTAVLGLICWLLAVFRA